MSESRANAFIGGLGFRDEYILGLGETRDEVLDRGACLSSHHLLDFDEYRRVEVA